MDHEIITEWNLGEDLPHLEYMDDNGLTPEDFSNSMRVKLDIFDMELEEALRGIKSDDEYDHLHEYSQQLRTLMEKEIAEKAERSKKLDGQDIALIAIFSGIAASIGLGKLFRS